MTVIDSPPPRTEAAEYYFTYIDKVGEGDIRDLLSAQMAQTSDFLGTISEDKSLFRYAPDKWSMREVLSHINDTERAFAFRALWFARGFDTPLPSFDQETGVRGAAADQRAWASHVEEFVAIRRSTVALFQSLPPEAWMRDGIASGNRFTVRALAYIIVGHVTHHLMVLRERYR